MADNEDRKLIKDMISYVNGIMEYHIPLNDDDRFISIEGLNVWVEDVINALFDAGIDISAGGAEEEGVPDTGARLPSTFGELNGAILMEASGDGNDCLIHSFLTTTCPAFQTLSEIGRISVARHFRRVVLAGLSRFQNLPKFDPEPIYQVNKNGKRYHAEELKYNPKSRKYEKTGKLAYRNVSDYLDKPLPLSDEFANRLAEQFNIGILLVQSQEDLPFAQLRNPRHSKNMVVIHGTGAHFTPVRLPRMPEHGQPYVMPTLLGERVLNDISHAFSANVAELWECPRCLKKNPIDDMTCQYCGTRNPAAPANIPAVSSKATVSSTPAVSSKAAVSSTPTTSSVTVAKLEAARKKAQEALQVHSGKNESSHAITLKNKKASSVNNFSKLAFLNTYTNAELSDWATALGYNIQELRKKLGRNKTQKANNKAKMSTPLTKTQRAAAALARLREIRAKSQASSQNNKRLAAKVTASMPNISKLSLNNTRKNKTNKEKAKELGLSIKNYYNLMAAQLMYNTKK
uniref:RanBP2-type domain-containing protein n=1 Tax=viral metagenome TaxID=1070528 RepID=A0A6C0KT84_9ZZZZ